MQNFKKNILDRLIEEFSNQDLKKRMIAMSVLGIFFCILIVIAAWFFLTSRYTVVPGLENIPFWKMLWLGK